MADTTIDSLVVTLGLDSSEFKKGQERAEQSFKEMTKAVSGAAQSMTSAVSGLAAEFIGLFLTVRGIGDVVHLFEGLNDSVRQLGFDSRNLGVATSQLRNWQEVAVLAGGSAEDATKSITSLQQSVFNLKFQGQVSDQIIGLQRLGVSALTTAGQMRPFKDILMDVARAFERNHFDPATRYQYATGYLGLSGGIANALVEGSKPLDDYYKEAMKSEQINRRNTDAAQALGKSWDELRYKVSGAATQILTNLTPSLVELFNHLAMITPQKLDDLAAWVQGPGASSIKEFFVSLNTIVTALAVTIEAIASTWNATFGPDSILDKVSRWAVGVEPKDTRGERNNNPLNLKNVPGQPTDAQGFSIFPTMGQGIAAAQHELGLYASRGIRSIRGIIGKWAPASDGNDTAAYIRSVSAALGKDPDLPLTAEDWPALLAAMAKIESGAAGQKSVQSALPAHPSALGAARGATPTPALSPPISANRPSHGGVNVDIGSMTVNTQAADAAGIAADMARAVQRKFNVFQADTGVVA